MTADQLVQFLILVVTGLSGVCLTLLVYNFQAVLKMIQEIKSELAEVNRKTESKLQEHENRLYVIEVKNSMKGSQ